LTLFSTGGTSQNVRVALLATVAPGETVVMARNGHKSAFAGLVLSSARPVYVDPVHDTGGRSRTASAACTRR
jgi:arginine/lysine/ornithine decarboxylase